MSANYEEILEHARGLEIIDTHEHLPAREELRNRETDVLKEYLNQYFNSDVRSAGLPDGDYRKVIDHTLPLMERWRLVEPYWEKARHTGYCRALDITARDLYGIERISGETIECLNEAFLRTLEPGHFRWVLKEKSRIKTSLLDVAPATATGRSSCPSTVSITSSTRAGAKTCVSSRARPASA